MLLSWVGAYGRIKRKMTIGKNIEDQKVGTKNLEELAKLTILNILSTKGIIYTHYKNRSESHNLEGQVYNLEYENQRD